MEIQLPDVNNRTLNNHGFDVTYQLSTDIFWNFFTFLCQFFLKLPVKAVKPSIGQSRL